MFHNFSSTRRSDISKIGSENYRILFTHIQSKLRLDRNLNLNITESTSNLKFKTRHF